jgi:hypothetical protein
VAKSSASLLAEKVSLKVALFDMYLQHFSFDSLGMSTAYDSVFLGNSISVMGRDNSTFIYTYSGWNTGIALDFDMIKIGYDLVLNDGAPSGNNYAHLAYASALYKNYTLKLSYFNNGTDPLPGTYSNLVPEGSLNRTGVLVKFGYNKRDLFWTLDYSDSQVKSENPYQSDEQIVAFNIGRNYEI